VTGPDLIYYIRVYGREEKGDSSLPRPTILLREHPSFEFPDPLGQLFKKSK